METKTMVCATTLGLRIGTSRTLVEVSDYAEASRIYGALRDDRADAGLGGVSTMPRGRIYRDGLLEAEVSYNGKVWIGNRCVYGEEGAQ